MSTLAQLIAFYFFCQILIAVVMGVYAVAYGAIYHIFGPKKGN